MGAEVQLSSGGLPDVVDAVFRREYADRLREVRRAPNTVRSYRSDWLHFQRWDERYPANSTRPMERRLIEYLWYWAAPVDPEGVPYDPRYPKDQALAVQTLQRRIYGIRHHLAPRGLWPTYGPHEDNLILSTLEVIAKGLEVPLRGATGRHATPLSVRLLRSAVELQPNTIKGMRDRVVLLVGFGAALRRSELVGLSLKDVLVDPEGEGIEVRLRSSKTGSRTLYVAAGKHTATDPVTAVRRWTATLRKVGMGGSERSLIPTVSFKDVVLDRHMRPAEVTEVIRLAVARAGVDPAPYSGHSLRSGLATAAAKAGAPARLIKQQTGHSSYEMVDRYVHTATGYTDNVTTYLDL